MSQRRIQLLPKYCTRSYSFPARPDPLTGGTKPAKKKPQQKKGKSKAKGTRKAKVEQKPTRHLVQESKTNQPAHLKDALCNQVHNQIVKETPEHVKSIRERIKEKARSERNESHASTVLVREKLKEKKNGRTRRNIPISQKCRIKLYITPKILIKI